MLLSLVLVGACTQKDDTGVGETNPGPVMVGDAPDTALEGSPLTVTVTATDTDGVAGLTLYERTQGVTDWTTLPMEGTGSDTFTATIPAEAVVSPGIEYYVKGVDGAEVPGTSYLPAEGSSGPYYVPVAVQGLPVPYFEDFEGTGTETDLSALGWGSASLGFRGYSWQLSTAQAHGGTNSAWHSHGYPDVATIEDWLVSPALDLSTLSDGQLTWYEYGASVTDAVHKLYVSTGSRDPADGDYVLLQDAVPAPPNQAWGRSQVVDLSAYAGEPTVYLAWYWEGVDADDWFIDDVAVQGLQPDLTIDWSVSPESVEPDGSATLLVTVANTATVDAADVTVSVAFPTGEITSDAPSVDVGAIAAGATATAELPVHVASTTANNHYVPMTLTADTGTSASSVDDRFLVGHASTATVSWNADTDGLVTLIVGTGDPDDPSWESVLFAGSQSAGSVDYVLDVTDVEGPTLPPAPGDGRWWLRGSTSVGGHAEAFDISYGGTDYGATVFPTADAGETVTVWNPEPPNLTLNATTSPSSIDPGTSGIRLSMSMTNTGAATSGGVTATLTSADPDVTITDAGPLVLSATSIGSGSRVSASGFSFDVSTAHTTSVPVVLDLVVSDDLESWTLPVSVNVPFPVLRVTNIEVDDDDGDGILDANEAASLSLQVTNVGDEATVGTAYGTLTVAGSSAVTATVPTDSVYYGTLAAASTRSGSSFDVTVGPGSPGDPLDLVLLMTDSTRSYEIPLPFVLGEPFWQSMSVSEDAPGDPLTSGNFDFTNGEFRVVDDSLQMRLHSSTVFDPSTLFIESWGLSSGAEWIYYRLVLQAGSVTLQGYDESGFHTIGEASVSFPDAYTVEFDLPVSSLGLLLTEISFGWGSGWCGPPEYYCDQWPDAWGYPYDSFTTSNWMELSW